MSSLIDFVKAGDSEAVKAMLSNGAVPDIRDEAGWSALHWASQSGMVQIIRALVRANAEVDCKDPDGITPLALAVGENQMEAVSELLSAGADPSLRIAAYEDGTVVHLACSWGYLEIVRQLLDAAPGAIAIRDREGKTPLSDAQDGGFLNLIDYLTTLEKL